MNQKSTYAKLQDNREWAQLQEVARLANDLQREHPRMLRSEALRLAEEFIREMA